MRARYLKTAAEFLFVVLAAVVALSSSWAMAGEAALPATEYQLEAHINGQPTGFISRFVDLGDGRLGAPASELRDLGIKVPDERADAEIVALDGFPGLSYVYDEAKQSINIETGDTNRTPKRYDARGESDRAKTSPTGYGAVLNYSAYATSSNLDVRTSLGSTAFEGINVALESRFLAPVGVFSNSAILGATLADETNALRLETTYTFADDDNMVTWRAGDSISGGTAWTRPYRFGGAQAQRTFSMRPDLVTTPMPSFSGSAAVPSTVDVFVNGIKSYSKEVAAGPYQIENIPSISSGGVAQVVTRDAAGREVVQSLSFYASPQLLRSGLWDFSMEGGLPRNSYGIESFDYQDKFAGSATVRSGFTDWLTGEAHAEGNGTVWNAGGGVVARAFDLAIVSAAASASTSDRGEGFQLYGRFETKVGPLSINGRAQQSFSAYDDVAAHNLASSANGFGFIGFASPGFITGLRNTAPPRAIDAITVSTPLTFDKSTISASYIKYQLESEKATQVITTTYSRPFFGNSSINATGFIDLADTTSAGLYLGVNIPFGDNVSLNGGLQSRGHDVGGYAEASKPVDQDVGSWGWRIRDYEGNDAYRSATVGYRASAARLEAGINQDSSGVRATAQADGAVAMLGGNVFASNRIDGAFAVVDAHEPGVRVMRENVVIGTTDSDGKILIPSLNAYYKNKIAIDPMDLPLDAEIASTLEYVAPSFKSGVYVEFDVKKAKPSAIVILKDASGKFLAAGSEGHLDGSDEPFIVGYDGQAFVKGLQAVNTIHVINNGRECTAQFSFGTETAVQPTIGPEICQ